MSTPQRAGQLSAPVTFRPETERWVLVATILGSAMAFLDGTVVNVALPVLQVDLNATTAGVQWVVESYALFLGALILIGGALGDRLGRRRVYVVGTSVFAVASLLCGVAPSLKVLIIARAIQGVGAALLVPGSLAMITAIFPKETRGRAIGTWAGFSAITSALGPVIGGGLIQLSSWRSVFFINVPLAVAVVAICLRFIPETRDEESTGTLDWRGAILATVGLGAVVLGLLNASNLDAGITLWLPLIAGVLALAAFIWTETRVVAPMMPLTLFRSPTFLGANLLTVFLYGALGGVTFFLPFNLIRVQHYTPTEAGAAFVPFPVLLFLLSRWAGGLMDRYGAKLPLIVGPSLGGCGLALLAVPSIGGLYWTSFFPAVIVLALGFCVLIAPLTTTVMNSVSVHRAGVASGINNAASRVAGLVTIACFGIIAVQTFSRALSSRLRALPLSAADRAAIQAQATRLVGARIPAHVGTPVRAEAQHAVDLAFVSSFRALMLVAAAMAFLSAACAALMVSARSRAAPDDASSET